MAETIALTQLPADYALPGVFIELDPSQAGGQADEAGPWCIFAQKTTAGAAVAYTEYRIPSKSEAVRLSGEGSIGAQMAEKYLSEDIGAGRDLRMRLVPDAAASAKATGVVILDGTATAAGELDLYIGGRRVATSVGASDTNATVATAANAAIGVARDLGATCAVDTSTATLKMTYSATPATPGKVLYCAAATTGTNIGTLNCDNTGGSAASAVTLSDADTIPVADNDASGAGAADGTAVYYNETLDRLEAAFPDGADRYVMTAARHAIGVYYSATAASGRAVYFDDDAAGATDRVLCVTGDTLDATAALVTRYLDFTARNGGTVMNDLDLRHSHNLGEKLPTGLKVGVSPMTGGATDPTITDLITAIGDTAYDCIIHPWDTSTQLDALDTEMFRRWNATVGVMGHTICGTAGSASTMEALGDSENDRYLSFTGAQACPSPPWEVAAAYAGRVRPYMQTSVGYQGVSYTVPKDVKGLALTSIVPPAPGDALTAEEANALIIDGVSPLMLSGSNLRIGLFVTNEQTDENGQATTRYRHALHVFDDMSIHRALKARLSAFLAGKRVTTDATTTAPNTVTLKDIERETDSVAYALNAVGLIENMEQFLANRRVTKPSANRVAVLFPLDRTNPLDQIGVVNQPRLDYAS